MRAPSFLYSSEGAVLITGLGLRPSQELPSLPRYDPLTEPIYPPKEQDLCLPS